MPAGLTQQTRVAQTRPGRLRGSAAASPGPTRQSASPHPIPPRRWPHTPSLSAGSLDRAEPLGCGTPNRRATPFGADECKMLYENVEPPPHQTLEAYVRTPVTQPLQHLPRPACEKAVEWGPYA